MAKNKNTFEKRRKEMEKTRKATAKRERKLARKSAPVDPDSPGGPPILPAPDLNDPQFDATPPM